MNHYFYRSAGTGVLLRAGLITAIYDKALTLSNRARHIHSNGKMVNHISTDVSRVDLACQYFHVGWTAPVQLIICLVILLVNLGPSALAGFAVFVIVVPMQTMFIRAFIRFRQNSVVSTDKRAKLLQELLSSIKIIKFFAWEDPYLARIHQVRGSEVTWVYLVWGSKYPVLMAPLGTFVPLYSSEQPSHPPPLHYPSWQASSPSSSTESIIRSTPQRFSPP